MPNIPKNFIAALAIGAIAIGGAVYLRANPTEEVRANNVEVREGVQYVTIEARGGYTPRVSTIEPNIPTTLIVKTTGSYDCSLALVIRSIGFQKMLQPVGEERIDIGTPKAGDTLRGLCSMGMYSFEIKS